LSDDAEQPIDWTTSQMPEPPQQDQLHLASVTQLLVGLCDLTLFFISLIITLESNFWVVKSQSHL
jgi:hypothetical protein